ISLRSVASASAINGGDSLAPPSMISDLDRVASKARVLVRVPKPPQTQSQLSMGLMPPPRESSDSLRQASPPGGGGGGGRAKRVVSRVIQHFAPDGASASSSSKSRPPYLAGRFANTDTAVGCYSAEVFSYEGSGGPPAGRPRGATTESLDTAAPKVRSIVYSGPIVSHATGGVSVTFTSQAVRDLPLATTAEHIPEEDEELELSDHRGGRSSASSVSPQGTKRVRATTRAQPTPTDNDDDGDDEEHDIDDDNNSVESVVGIESAALISAAAKNKKKRRLHAAHTVIDIEGSGGSSFQPSESRFSAVMPSSYVPLTGNTPPQPPLMSRVSRAAVPQESKQPVLFTPVRTRSKHRLPTDTSPTDQLETREDKNESIFLTPMKMLNRLRHRKK
ncbi:hypothetical protein GGF42_009003, partial [Coemansia sp. RSA 2424]